MNAKNCVRLAVLAAVFAWPAVILYQNHKVDLQVKASQQALKESTELLDSVRHKHALEARKVASVDTHSAAQH